MSSFHNDKTQIEVSKTLVDLGRHHGLDAEEMLQSSLKVAQNSLLRGALRTAVRDRLRTRKSGLLIIIGQTGSGYWELAHEVAAMAVADVKDIAAAPFVINELETRAHVQAALVASYHTVVIASLHAASAERAKLRLSSILGQDANEAHFDLIGMLETRAITPARDDGWEAMRPALVARFLVENPT